MLYIITGQVRSGKTLTAINETKKFYEAGYTIYSNIPLSFKYIPLTRKMILEWEKNDLDLPPKSMFLIDEIHAWFDSRNSGNSNNKIFSYFITQLGKFTENKSKGLTILGTTQFFGQIDIRGRRVTDTIIECKKLEEKEGEYVRVLRIYKKNNNLVIRTYKKEVVLFNQRDFELYDTQTKVKSDTN
jgi:hypothetical protein